MSHEKKLEQLRTSLQHAEHIQMELDRRVYYLKTLYDVSKDIFGSVEYEQILKNFLLMTMGNFGVAKGFILTVDIPSREINGFVSMGFLDDDISLIKTGGSEILLSTDLAMSMQGETDLTTCDLLPPSMICTFPFVLDKNCLGIMALGAKLTGEVYNRDDKELLDTLVNDLVVALKNARSFKEIKNLNLDLQEKNIQLETALDQLRAAMRKERLAAIGQAVTGVAHCIKNVLNGLEGGMFILKKAAKESESKISEQGLSMLERNHVRLKELVLDMLAYSKEREPEYKVSNLNEITASVVELMQIKANERKILLRFHPMEDLEEIIIDPQGIYRCILNLVSNAMDACEGEDSVVDVSIKSPESGQIAVEIRDNGCGMNEAELQSIFKLFYSTKGSGGTGFGLAITQKIVKEHGGKIEVASTPGEGTTFRIFLPRPHPATA